MESIPGFTPVRRRDQPQYNESPALSAHAPWTTARCNRLLRPISSRIALLRKTSYQSTNRDASIRRDDQDKHMRVDDDRQCLSTVLANKQGVGQRVEAASHRKDPDWAPSPVPRRKIKHTYAGRCMGQIAKQSGAKRQCLDSALPCDGAPGVSNYGNPDYPQHLSLIQPDAEEARKFGGIVETDGSSIEGQRKPCRSSRNRDIGTDTRESFSKLAKTVSPSQWMLINGLYDGLYALLKATSSSKPSNAHSPRSLLATCLRRVPDYIAAEQNWHDQENPDSEMDMSSVIYGDLESYGPSCARGWKPLREVVRSHGVALLGEAVKDGLIKQDIARGLILLCLRSSAFDEAQHLVECLIAVAGRLPKPSTANAKLLEVDASACLRTLDLFARRSGRFHVQFRHLARLLNDGFMPIEWMGTHDFVTCWKRVIDSISRTDDRAGDANHLLRTAMSLSYDRMGPAASSRIHNLRLGLRVDESASEFESRETVYSTRRTVDSRSDLASSHDSELSGLERSLNNTVSSLLVFLCSTILQPSSDIISTSMEPSNCSSTALRHLALEAQQACELAHLETALTRFTFCAERASLLLLADALIGLRPTSHRPDTVHIDIAHISVIANSSTISAIESMFTPFLCAAVQCCERGSPGGAFERLQSFVQRLVQISTFQDIEPATRKLCGRIAVTTALEFSEGTGQPKHLEWALDVEDDVDGHHSKLTRCTPTKTPAREANKSGNDYRWEEGLCEWIAKTPAMLSKKSDAANGRGQDSSSESDSWPPSPTCISEISPYNPSASRTRRASGEVGHHHGHGRHNRASCGADELLIDHGVRGAKCSGGSKSGVRLLRQRVFQETHVDDEVDELSTPESSEEQLKIGRRSLHEITNVHAHVGGGNARKGAGTRPRKELRSVTRPQVHDSLAGRKKCDASWPWLVSTGHEEESEDELVI